MTSEQRAQAWELAVQYIEYSANGWSNHPVEKYINDKIIPQLHAKAKSLRRRERAKDPRNKTDVEPEI